MYLISAHVGVLSSVPCLVIKTRSVTVKYIHIKYCHLAVSRKQETVKRVYKLRVSAILVFQFMVNYFV